MRKKIERRVKIRVFELNKEIKKWAQKNNYIDKDGNNIKKLSNEETIEMLQKLEKHLSEYDKANGYIFSKVPENRTIIPYTDQYNNLFSWRMADNISERTPNYSYVSETAIGAISMDDEFKDTLYEITGKNSDITEDQNFMDMFVWGTSKTLENGEIEKTQSPILENGKPFNTGVRAFVDYISDRVMSEEVGNLKGDVFALVSHSRSSNVFARTELLLALSYKEGTINGLPRDELYKAYEEQFNELLGENPEVTVNDIKYYELRTQALEVALKPVMDRCDEIIEDIYVCVNDEIDNDSFELDLSGSEFFHHQKNPNITNEYTRIPFKEYLKAADELGQMLKEGKVIFKSDPNPEKGKVEKLSRNIADIRPQTVSRYMQGKEITQMYVGVIENGNIDKQLDIDISEIFETPEISMDSIKAEMDKEPQVNVRLTSDSSVETRKYNIAEFADLMKHTSAITGFDIIQGKEKLYDGTGKAFYNSDKEKDLLTYLKVNTEQEQYAQIEKLFPKSQQLYSAMVKYESLQPSALRETAHIYAVDKEKTAWTMTRAGSIIQERKTDGSKMNPEELKDKWKISMPELIKLSQIKLKSYSTYEATLKNLFAEKGHLSFDLNQLLESKGVDPKRISTESIRKIVSEVSKLDLQFPHEKTAEQQLNSMRMMYTIHTVVDAELHKIGNMPYRNANNIIGDVFETYKKGVLEKLGIEKVPAERFQKEKQNFINIIKTKKLTAENLAECFTNVQKIAVSIKEQENRNITKDDRSNDDLSR